MASGKQKYLFEQHFKQQFKNIKTRFEQLETVFPLPPTANSWMPASFAPDNHFLRLKARIADELAIDLSFLPPHLTRDEDTVGEPFDVGKPTCSVNLLCHRNGILQKYQVQVISKDRCAGPDQYDSLIASNRRLIKSDIHFFQTVKKTYEKRMCGIWRSMFSLKALREIRLVSFTPFDHRPVSTFLREYIKQDILFAYRYPEKLHSNDEWIQWVYNLRQPDRRYALEFVESWSSLKILLAISALLASSTTLGVAWAVVKDDAQTAFTIASFVLGAGSLLLAALATVSSIEASTSDGGGQSQLLQDMNIHYTPADQDNTPTNYLIPKADNSKSVYPCESPGCNKVFINPEYRRRHNLEHNTSFTIQGPDVTRQEDTVPELESINED